MADPEDSLLYPSSAERADDSGPQLGGLPEPKDLTSEQIEKLLSGVEFDPFMDEADLREVLLRRQYEQNDTWTSLVTPATLLVVLIFAFFGWKLYKSLKDKQLKQEEKKKLKMKKKK